MTVNRTTNAGIAMGKAELQTPLRRVQTVATSMKSVWKVIKKVKQQNKTPPPDISIPHVKETRSANH